MRTAQLIETLETGGAERLSVQIASGLSGRGHDSHLIVLTGTGPMAAGLDPGVFLHNLGMDAAHLGSQVRALSVLRSLCRKLGIEALQTHLPRANFFGLALAATSRLAVYPTVHNNLEFAYGSSGRLRKSARRTAYRALVRRARAMIAVSDAVKEAMVEDLGLAGGMRDRIAVVTNGVPVPPRDSAARTAGRRAWGISDHETLIVAVGRLEEQKNLADLVHALELLPDGVPSWRCIIAGSGRQRDMLDRLVASAQLTERIRLAGRVEDVPGLLQAADIFAMPSLWEGLPLALLEAMAAGLPVVGYAVDGIREIIADSRTGFLAEARDSAGLAQALATLIKDGPVREAMGMAARKVVETEYSLDAVVERLEGIYSAGIRA